MNALEQIKPETMAIIRKQAEFFGLSVDDYLRSLLPQSEKELALKSDSSKSDFEADWQVFAEGTENLPEYDGTYSREDIYFDHN